MRYYKLINEDCIHHGLKYQPNTTVTDPIPFRTDGECRPGGIYFFSEKQLFEEDFLEFVLLDTIKYICEVTIPEDAQVYHETGKSKASSLTFGEFREAWEDERFCLAAVRQNGLALRFVERQTPENCLMAVQDYGIVLKYVCESLKTPEICMAAVMNIGLALKYVGEDLQTPEICMAAVQNEGWALKDMKDEMKTPELCMVAVTNQGCAIQFVKKEMQTPELCLAAVQNDKDALSLIDEEMWSRIQERQNVSTVEYLQAFEP